MPPVTPIAPAAHKQPPPMVPTVADVAYGADPAQKFDIYRPETGTGPFPVLLWYHGGGWQNGNKHEGFQYEKQLLKSGCAYVSADYRLLQTARAQKISPPIDAVFSDNRHALQYLRLHAAEWNLDPNRIMVGGSSAGACSALFMACEGEVANPQAADPLDRVSTTVLGACVVAAQATLDPKLMREWVPGVNWTSWAFGYPTFNQFLADRDKILPLISKYSPDILMSKDTPPIYFSYTQPLPGPEGLPNEKLVHCPLWGIGFQKAATAKGVACYVRYPGHPSEKYNDLADFTLHILGISSN